MGDRDPTSVARLAHLSAAGHDRVGALHAIPLGIGGLALLRTSDTRDLTHAVATARRGAQPHPRWSQAKMIHGAWAIGGPHRPQQAAGAGGRRGGWHWTLEFR